MSNNQNGHSTGMFQEYPDIITIVDLQAMLHIGRNAAYKLLQDNSIVSIRVGKKYIIPKASVASFITEGLKMKYHISKKTDTMLLDMIGCSTERRAYHGYSRR